MKTQYRMVLLAAAIGTLFVTQAQAQYRAVGSDGIAASPKLRVMLDERARSGEAPFTVAAVSGSHAAVTKTATTPTKCCGQCCDLMTQQAQPAPSTGAARAD
jgi:hypothetical protein